MEQTLTIREQVAELNSKRYVYFLINENKKFNDTFDLKSGQPVPTPKYPPSVTIPNVSSIVWPGGKDPFGKDRPYGKHLIRYYVGCTNLFVDEQPKEKEIIEQFMRNQFNQFQFTHGRCDVYAADSMRKMFMDLASFNIESDYRSTSVKAFYKPYDEVKEKKSQGDRLKKQREAMNLASTADDAQVEWHAKFLGIPFVDYDTQDVRSLEMIRIDYEQKAADNPEVFIDTFGKTEFKAKHLVEQAVQSGLISLKKVPGKAVWNKTKVEICLIPENCSQKEAIGLLTNFSTTKEGTTFLKELEISIKPK